MEYQDISITLDPNRLGHPATLADFESVKKYRGLKFGVERSAHIFLMDFEGDWQENHEGEWKDPRIIPYQEAISDLACYEKNFEKGFLIPPRFSAGSKVLHYGYGIFEGAKTFRHDDGELNTFRLEKNANRSNKSARMLCMPTVYEEDYLLAAETLIDIDRNYFPQGVEGASLYTRSFLFANQDQLGVRPGNKFTFAIFLSPSGPYYESGFNPIDLLVQKHFFRAGPGGVGGAKAAGNYAGAARAGELALLLGASQCLFLDATNQNYIEEVGTSGFAMLERGELILPRISDTILNSITMQSVEELVQLEPFNLKVKREDINIDRLWEGIKKGGNITDVFGLGTAAVVSPVSALRWLRSDKIDKGILRKVEKGEAYVHDLVKGRNIDDLVDIRKIQDGKVGEFTAKLFEHYTGIQTGRVEDKLGYLKQVPRRF